MGNVTSMEQGLLVAGETENPKACVIWLHGLGASADDFIPAVPYLKLPEQAGVKFLFPQAPVRPVTINSGWEMPAWYDILRMLPEREIVPEHLQQAAQALHYLTRQQVEAGISADQIYWAGFSQGGAVVLEAALNSARYQDAVLPKAVFALSTYQALPIGQTADLTQVSFWHAHGSCDDVVPFTMGKKAFENTESLSQESHWQPYPMSHEVCVAQLEAMGQYLSKQLRSA